MICTFPSENSIKRTDFRCLLALVQFWRKTNHLKKYFSVMYIFRRWEKKIHMNTLLKENNFLTGNLVNAKFFNDPRGEHFLHVSTLFPLFDPSMQLLKRSFRVRNRAHWNDLCVREIYRLVS